MSIDLVAKNCDFSDLNMGYVPSVASGLQYLNFFGGSSSRAMRNLADDSTVSIVGSPGHNPYSSVFTPNSAYVKTAALQAEQSTLLIAAKLTDASSMLMGTYTGARANGDGYAASRGMNIWTSIGTGGDGLVGISFVAGMYSGASGAASENLVTQLTNVPVGWKFLSFSIGASLESQVMDHTSGASNSLSVSGKQIDRNTQPFQIGSSPVAAGFGAPNEIAFAAIYSRILSVQEKDSMYRSIKAYLGSKGVSI